MAKTLSIEFYSKQISFLHIFLAVYSADNLPTKWLPRQYVIVNYCPSNRPENIGLQFKENQIASTNCSIQLGQVHAHTKN